MSSSSSSSPQEVAASGSRRNSSSAGQIGKLLTKSLDKLAKNIPFIRSPTISPTSRTNANTFILTPAPCLPIELLRIILEYLAEERWDESYSYSIFPYNPPRTFKLVNPVRNASLVTASSVSRLWNVVANEFLYSRVYITSMDQTSHFLHSIRKSPTLAPIVKQLYLVGAIKPLAYSKTVESRALFGRLLDDLASVLRLCPNLRYLTLVANQLPIHNFMLKKIARFGRKSQFALRIHNFTVWGPAEYTMDDLERPLIPSELELPNLEVLCLRELTLPQTFDLPRLPRLRTLRLIRLGLYWQSDVTFRATSTLLPCLETLELYHILIPINVDDGLLRKLKRLHMIGGTADSIVQGRGADFFTHLPNLEYFALGLMISLHEHNCSLFVHYLERTPSLPRSLMVILHAPGSTNELADSSCNQLMLQSLFGLVGLLSEPDSPLAGSLQEIIILDQGWNEERPLSEMLRSTCSTIGIICIRDSTTSKLCCVYFWSFMN